MKPINPVPGSSKKSGVGPTDLAKADSLAFVADTVRIASLLAVPLPKKSTANADMTLIDIVRAGVSQKAFSNLTAATGLAPTEIAQALHISDRTLRRYTPEQKFPPEQSERLVEIAQLYIHGEAVFGSMEGFSEWMESKQLAFGNEAPKNLLDTSIGISLINDQLGRMKYGIFV